MHSREFFFLNLVASEISIFEKVVRINSFFTPLVMKLATSVASWVSDNESPLECWLKSLKEILFIWYDIQC